MILDIIKTILDSWEEVKIVTVTGVWKKSITTNVGDWWVQDFSGGINCRGDGNSETIRIRNGASICERSFTGKMLSDSIMIHRNRSWKEESIDVADLPQPPSLQEPPPWPVSSHQHQGKTLHHNKITTHWRLRWWLALYGDIFQCRYGHCFYVFR